MEEEYKDIRYVTDEEIDRDMFPDSFVREYNAYFARRQPEYRRKQRMRYPLLRQSSSRKRTLLSLQRMNG